MARLHRGETTRMLCTMCAVGRPPSDFERGPSPRSEPSLFDAADSLPSLLLQTAMVVLGAQVPEGRLIEAITPAWLEIVRQVERNPRFIYEAPWRKVEELLAGAYKRDGWDEVILTPRSADHGRDIIATKQGFCSIRVVDQVKAYSRDRCVTADEVRSLLGVLSADQNVSKGLVTTTAKFAPGIKNDPLIQPFIPHRLDLRDGEAFRIWLVSLAHKERVSGGES